MTCEDCARLGAEVCERCTALMVAAVEQASWLVEVVRPRAALDLGARAPMCGLP